MAQYKTGFVTCRYIAAVFFSCFLSSEIAIAETAVTEEVRLRFCYEDKQLLPYYAEDGQHIPERPGATVEHLQRIIRRIPGLVLVPERYPWLRCQSRLQHSETDAIVAGYHPDRDTLGVYPRLADHQVDYERAVSKHGNCLVRRKDADEDQSADGLVVARPRGYVHLGLPENMTIVFADSQESAYRLTASGRVHATLALCLVNGIRGEDPALYQHDLKVIYPPLAQSAGFLVFSYAFYEAHPQLAEKLWQSMPQYQQEDAEVYYHYLHQYEAEQH